MGEQSGQLPTQVLAALIQVHPAFVSFLRPFSGSNNQFRKYEIAFEKITNCLTRVVLIKSKNSSRIPKEFQSHMFLPVAILK